MWPDTRLLDRLGIALPIVQAPMAGADSPALAAAVSEAGGLGSLAGALRTPEGLAAAVAEVRARTGRPFNLNFFAHAEPAPDPGRARAWLDRLAPYYAELGLDPPATLAGGRAPFDAGFCTLVEALRPAVVSFHFGLPEAALMARVKATGAAVLASATTPEEAVWLVARGVDAVIAQGSEAGGHRGTFAEDWRGGGGMIGTLALVPQVVDAVAVPVIAAGGIADGRGIAAALALGAAGVQIGTAYLFTPEAAIGRRTARRWRGLGRRDLRHQRAHRPAGAGGDEPADARGGPDRRRGARVPAGRPRQRALAPGGRGARPARFHPALGGAGGRPRPGRGPGGLRRGADPRPGRGGAGAAGRARCPPRRPPR